MSAMKCLPELWSRCSFERTDEAALNRLLNSFVSFTMPATSNNLATVHKIVENCSIPVESLSEELANPAFIRGRPYFGFAGDKFDEIANNYASMQWWITEKGLNFGPAVDRWDLLKRQYEALKGLKPHPRGYAFESFLETLFLYFGLAPRKSFRLTGEQIDGSFQLQTLTFLVEAKWQQEKVDAAGLRSFALKIGSKSQWTRGLYISDSGFTDVGLQAFQSGFPTPLICLDGGEIEQILNDKFDFPELLLVKMRATGETNRAHIRIDELLRTYGG
jgi:Restriction endonuclease